MKLNWNEALARWYGFASQYTGFHRELGKRLHPYLKEVKTLCDIGCGLGLIDLELAGRVEAITCYDISEYAISKLQAEARERGIPNIQAQVADFRHVAGNWDACLLSFFGMKEPESFFALADRVIILTNEGKEDSLLPGNKHLTFCELQQERRIRGERVFPPERLLHQLQFELEFGQPFVDEQDLEAFARAYGDGQDGAAKELAWSLRKRAGPSTDPRFSCYVPHTKRIGLYVLGK